MKTIGIVSGLLVVVASIVACEGKETDASDVGEMADSNLTATGGGKCNSGTLGRKVRKFDCVQDAQCNWNQCLGDDRWGGFSNDVCAPVAPWQNPPCNGGFDAADPRDGTFARPGCAFYVPAVGDDDRAGFCDATDPTHHQGGGGSSSSGGSSSGGSSSSGGGSSSGAPPEGAVCVSAMNPDAVIKAYDCFEHGGDWFQCREDGEWVAATLEASGKVFGPLQAPGIPVAGCLTTHRH